MKPTHTQPSARRKPTQAQQLTAIVRKHLGAMTGEPETVSQFLARGGRIDRLSGIQKSNVYQPRRPVMVSYRSMA